MPFGMKPTFEMFPPFNIEVQDMALIFYVSVVSNFIHMTTYTHFDMAFVVNNTT
jgi:hypothetical protein